MEQTAATVANLIRYRLPEYPKVLHVGCAGGTLAGELPPSVHYLGIDATFSARMRRQRSDSVSAAMAQQKGRQLLTRLTQTANRRQTGAHEIADRLMSWIRNPDRVSSPARCGGAKASIAAAVIDPIPGML